MFDSISALEKRARKLVSDCYDWIEHHSSGPEAFNPVTPTTALGLANASVRIDGFARLAEELMAEPGFSDATFDPVLKQDVIEIAEEFRTAHGEILTHIHPDNLWQNLHHGQKTELIHNHVVDDQKIDFFRARLKGDIRKQGKVPKPADEPTPDPALTVAPPPPPPPPAPGHNPSK